jgi:hypothetical protein
LTPHWDTLFLTRRNIDGITEDENKPWMELHSEHARRCQDDHGDEEYDEERTLIRTSMDDQDMADIMSFSVDCFEKYADDGNRASLQADVWPGKKLPCKAWVGEGGEGWFKPRAEWLTAHQLYQALKKPVSHLSTRS